MDPMSSWMRLPSWPELPCLIKFVVIPFIWIKNAKDNSGLPRILEFIPKTFNAPTDLLAGKDNEFDWNLWTSIFFTVDLSKFTASVSLTSLRSLLGSTFTVLVVVVLKLTRLFDPPKGS